MPSSLTPNFTKAFFSLFKPIETKIIHAATAKIIAMMFPAEKANTTIKKENITSEYAITKHFTNLGDDTYFFIITYSFQKSDFFVPNAFNHFFMIELKYCFCLHYIVFMTSCQEFQVILHPFFLIDKHCTCVHKCKIRHTLFEICRIFENCPLGYSPIEHPFFVSLFMKNIREQRVCPLPRSERQPDIPQPC